MCGIWESSFRILICLCLHWSCVCLCLKELCHTQAGLKIFLIVIPREGLDGTSPVKPSFGLTPTTLTIELYSSQLMFYIQYHDDYRIVLWLYVIIFVVLQKCLVGLVPVRPSFCMTMTKILRAVFVWHSCRAVETGHTRAKLTGIPNTHHSKAAVHSINSHVA